MQTAQDHCARAASEGRKRAVVAEPEFKLITKEPPGTKEDEEEDADRDADALNRGLEPFLKCDRRPQGECSRRSRGDRSFVVGPGRLEHAPSAKVATEKGAVAESPPASR